ncbi:MAG: hypothetical protein OHK0048_06180 [Rhodoferax sp.]
MRAPVRPGPRAGLTLIELLVALSLMALVSVLSWRGIDGLTQARARLRAQGDDVLLLQATLTQWRLDLDALAPQPKRPALDWDGRTLRLLRHAPLGNGAVVVAWGWRAQVGQPALGEWVRWQSPPLTDRAALDAAWQQAPAMLVNRGVAPAHQALATVALTGWQLFYYRNNAWSNPLSSVGAEAEGGAARAESGVPDGVRAVLDLAPGQALSGRITQDWVNPLLRGAR